MLVDSDPRQNSALEPYPDSGGMAEKWVAPRSSAKPIAVTNHKLGVRNEKLRQARAACVDAEPKSPGAESCDQAREPRFDLPFFGC